jgi:ABC-2 type transport system permease protein
MTGTPSALRTTDTRAQPVVVRSAFAELSSWNAKEMYRNKKSAFSILFMFVFFFILIVGLNFVINYGNRPDPVVAITGDTATVQEITSALETRGIATTSDVGEGSDANATVVTKGDKALLILNSQNKPTWIATANALSDAGYTADDISVADENGAPEIDLLRSNLAGLAAIGLMAISFMGTAASIVSLRERGTLRLLGTTPLKKLTFIAAQTPVRFVLGAAVGVIIAVVAAVLGYIDLSGLARLAITFILGLLMFFSFTYLLASRSRNSEFINQVSVFITILALFISGNVFPKDFLPDAVLTAINVLPTTWFMQAAGADLAGTPTFANIYVLWALMAVTTAIVAPLAAKLFLWDDRER